MDKVDFIEKEFCFPDLLKTHYFRKYREDYYDKINNCFPLGPRNYLNLLTHFNEINEYNKQHAQSFAKRIRADKKWRNQEGVFCEIIIYRYYIKLVSEGLIRSIDLIKGECDIILERLDGTKAYLEAFCVMPNLKDPQPEGGVVNDIRTHTQTELSSIRQKLLAKINKQKQFSKPRDNYAVIELNNPKIAGDFSVPASLSDGYKVQIDKETMEATSEGYDWQDSIFEDECTRFLKGVIYFSLGNYDSRKYIENPNFCR